MIKSSGDLIKLWIATAHGLSTTLAIPSDGNGAVFNTINPKQDREGNIWLGTKAGLSVLKHDTSAVEVLALKSPLGQSTQVQTVFNSSDNLLILITNRHTFKVDKKPLKTVQTRSSLSLMSHYRFDVQATRDPDNWPIASKSTEIIITPPWWKTWWAYLSYAIVLIKLALSILWLVYRRELAEKDRQSVVAVILGPIARLREKAQEPTDRKVLAVVERNAHRLATMVDHDTITVESEVGKGSRFSVTMPLSQTQSKPEGEVLTNTNQINDIKTDDLGDKNIESIQRFEKLVADNYHDKDFNRKEVASEMALSERQLHRKLAGLVYTTSVTSYVSSVYNKPATC